ncbi:MAG: ATP synthase F1 subunit gamma [Muribaculaceae bacterium]|nr:ATP synthase F1 subunit gamma [Muribaculaceae bacterium]MDE6703760.1 ATP synthase F1 subunit gamma [Muribaculaceae bacterium]
MATLRELKSRIGSVASSEKITGAMKMISSAKMHKAEAALRRLVPYRSQIETIIANLLSADVAFTSPLVEHHTEVKRVAIVVLGSDDGLCGAYNVNISKRLLARISELRSQYGSGLDIDIYPVGKKMIKIVSRFTDKTLNVVSVADDITTKSDGGQVKKFINALEAEFLENHVDLVDCVYMHYHSAGKQILKAEQLLPIDSSTFSAEGVAKASVRPYLFEPDAESIFRSVLPLFLLSVMQEIFAQNRASEQAARVMAMQSANDNAKKLLEQLQLEFNKLRQQSITTELLDIVGGQVRD